MASTKRYNKCFTQLEFTTATWFFCDSDIKPQAKKKKKKKKELLYCLREPTWEKLRLFLHSGGRRGQDPGGTHCGGVGSVGGRSWSFPVQ